jgi:hypothetical protein
MPSIWPSGGAESWREAEGETEGGEGRGREEGKRRIGKKIIEQKWVEMTREGDGDGSWMVDDDDVDG